MWNVKGQAPPKCMMPKQCPRALFGIIHKDRGLTLRQVLKKIILFLSGIFLKHFPRNHRTIGGVTAPPRLYKFSEKVHMASCGVAGAEGGPQILGEFRVPFLLLRR